MNIRGQQTGQWAEGKLRNQAVALSLQVPYATAIYDFSERYLTELSTLPEAERRSRLIRDDVKIVQGDFNRLSLIDEKSSLSFSEKNNRYAFGLMNDDFPIIVINFPADCQLILGKNLKELESSFLTGLTSYKETDRTLETINKKDLKELSENLFVKEGASYQIDAINRNQYFEIDKESNEISPIFSSLHPAESTFNLLLSDKCPCNPSINLVIRKYGLQKEYAQIPLSQLTSFMEMQGCTIYIGIEALKPEKIEATLFAVNNVLKYNHVMNLEIPYSLFTDNEEKINADINLFIPTHNITALFDELNTAPTSNRKE